MNRPHPRFTFDHQLRVRLIHVGRFLSLSVANVAASGTTFLLFAAVARVSSLETLSQFAIAIAITTLVGQVIDGGTTPVSVRTAVQSETPAHVVRSLVRRRMSLASLSAVAVGWALFLWGWSLSESIATSLLVLSTVAYGATIMALQGLSRAPRLVPVQWANAMLYGSLCIALVWDGESDSIVIPVSGMAGILGLLAFTVLWKGRLILGPTDRIRVASIAVVVAAIATAASNSVDTLFLGRGSDRLVAEYASNQRAALGISSLSVSLTMLLLPAASLDPARAIAWRRHLTFPLLSVPVLSGIMCFPIGGLAGVLYGSGELVHYLLLWCLLTAYGIGAVSVPLSVALVAKNRMWELAMAAALQGLVTISGAALAGILGNILLAGFAVLLGRCALVATLFRAAWRSPD